MNNEIEIVQVGQIEQQDWYVALIEECKAIITETIFNKNWVMIEGYHALGTRILEENDSFERSKIYGKEIVSRVTQSIGTSKRNIWRAIQFAKKYPDINLLPGGKGISWRKVCNELLPAPTDLTEPEINPSSYMVSRGQIWKLGRHRVICGDAHNLIDDLSADALITDPPYGIGYKPDWNKWDGSESDFNPVTGDEGEFDPTPFMNFPTVALFGANYFSDKLPRGGWLCWDKRTKEELDEMFGSPFELAWYRSVNTARKAIMVRLLHGGVVNADSAEGNNEKRYHATQKPVALMETILRELTMEEDIILDPFAGSGSTLLACERSNRTCIAVEIEPTIAAIILQRWADETGKEPCLE